RGVLRRAARGAAALPGRPRVAPGNRGTAPRPHARHQLDLPAARARRRRAGHLRAVDGCDGGARIRAPAACARPRRPPDRPAEPAQLRGAPGAGDRARAPRRDAAGAGLPRRRPLQAGQRHPRPRGGRRRAARVRPAPGRHRAQHRHGGAPRGRRIRRRAGAGRLAAGVRARRGQAARRDPRAVRAGRAHGGRHEQHRHRVERASGSGRAGPRGRRQPVPCQARGTRHGVRARLRYQPRSLLENLVGYPQQQEHGRPRAGRHRHRLRRHRHEPPVFAEDRVRPRARPAADEREPGRRRVADLLGPVRHRLVQVRDARAARRQPRRGRHHGLAGARAGRRRRPQAPARGAASHRRVRCGAVLRRQRDHARDLRAVRRRGAGSRDAGAAGLRRAAHDRDPGLPVRGAAPGHGRHRPLVRPRH
ncbi:hypothetical protein Lal_00015010, partial [Lupinus albus]